MNHECYHYHYDFNKIYCGFTQISRQKIGKLCNGLESDTIRFRAKTHTVTNDQMYVIGVIAEGKTDNNFTIGPLAEIVLQVDV